MAGGRFQGDLPERTFEFAATVLALVERLPQRTSGWVLGKQLARSGTSIGANVCEADHALSEAEFTHRCSVARKEASEAQYWLRLCDRTGLLDGGQAEPAVREANELMRILSTIVRKTQLQEV
jgi:four helix bundle protein